MLPPKSALDEAAIGRYPPGRGINMEPTPIINFDGQCLEARAELGERLLGLS
jgi:hypothetical protein